MKVGSFHPPFIAISRLRRCHPLVDPHRLESIQNLPNDIRDWPYLSCSLSLSFSLSQMPHRSNIRFLSPAPKSAAGQRERGRPTSLLGHASCWILCSLRLAQSAIDHVKCSPHVQDIFGFIFDSSSFPIFHQFFKEKQIEQAASHRHSALLTAAFSAIVFSERVSEIFMNHDHRC